MKLTLGELQRRVGNDEEAAYLLLEELRWPDGPECPHCGHDKAYFLTPKNPDGRRSGPKAKRSIRRVWKCAKCRKQFSVLTNTIFHGTKIPLASWLMVMVLMSASKNGIAAREVERLLGVTPETAWFMLHRLREAMRREAVLVPMTGTIVADETFIGGVMGNRPKKVRNTPQKVVPHGGPDYWGKTPVLSLVNRETGEVRSRVVADVTGATLRKVIADQVHMSGSDLQTDESNRYITLGQEFASHRTVNHSEDEYVRRENGTLITTNNLEGYFSQLKRSLDGTHHHVSREHLQRYLDEFDFRFTTRKLTDSERLQRMVDQADGRRLTYERITDN